MEVPWPYDLIFFQEKEAPLFVRETDASFFENMVLSDRRKGLSANQEHIS